MQISCCRPKCAHLYSLILNLLRSRFELFAKDHPSSINTGQPSRQSIPVPHSSFKFILEEIFEKGGPKRLSTSQVIIGCWIKYLGLS